MWLLENLQCSITELNVSIFWPAFLTLAAHCGWSHKIDSKAVDHLFIPFIASSSKVTWSTRELKQKSFQQLHWWKGSNYIHRLCWIFLELIKSSFLMFLTIPLCKYVKMSVALASSSVFSATFVVYYLSQTCFCRMTKVNLIRISLTSCRTSGNVWDSFDTHGKPLRS